MSPVLPFADPFAAFGVLDPEDESIIRPSDTEEYGFGTKSPYGDRAVILSSQQAKAEDNAMEYLRASLNRQAEVSPTQAFATALLAAVPTIGGYMIGNSIGRPELPPGYFEAGGKASDIGLDKLGSPGFTGALQGLEAGAGAAGGYLKGMEANQAQKNDVYTRMAQAELQKAGRLETQANSLENQRIAREDNQAFQRSMLDARTGAQKEVAEYKQELKPEGFGASDLETPEEQEAFSAISSGRGEPKHYSVLSPEALKQANQNARSAAYATSVSNSQQRFETQQSYSEAPGTVNISAMGNDPKLNAKRAEIIGQRGMAKNATTELALNYDRTSGAFFGGDRKKEEALAAIIYSAGRGLAGTGASLTGNEGAVIQAVSAPQMDIDGFTSWFHDYLMKGDPAEQVRIAQQAMDKAFNEKLMGYGKAFSEYAPQGSTPPVPVGGMPNRSDYKSPQEYLDALRKYNNG